MQHQLTLTDAHAVLTANAIRQLARDVARVAEASREHRTAPSASVLTAWATVLHRHVCATAHVQGWQETTAGARGRLAIEKVGTGIVAQSARYDLLDGDTAFLTVSCEAEGNAFYAVGISDRQATTNILQCAAMGYYQTQIFQ